MLEIAKEIFETNSIEEDSSGKRLKLHSNTSLDQCLFIQKIFDEIKPKKTKLIIFINLVEKINMLKTY